jgi:hypothetical protein
MPLARDRCRSMLATDLKKMIEGAGLTGHPNALGHEPSNWTDNDTDRAVCMAERPHWNHNGLWQAA